MKKAVAGLSIIYMMYKLGFKLKKSENNNLHHSGNSNDFPEHKPVTLNAIRDTLRREHGINIDISMVDDTYVHNITWVDSLKQPKYDQALSDGISRALTHYVGKNNPFNQTK